MKRKKASKRKRGSTVKRSPRRSARAKGNRSARRIDVRLKGITQTEPPINSNPGDLSAGFRGRLDAALAVLVQAGTPFKLVEGFRTQERQQWLYGSGRPNVQPYGRPGPILTNADGVNRLSKHQGNGSAGSGKAADCYPKHGPIPPATDPVWEAYALAVEAQGLVAGHHWTKLEDSPHSELT